MTSSNITTTTSNNNTSTPLSSVFLRPNSDHKFNVPKNASIVSSASFPNKLSSTISRIINEHKGTTSYFHSPESKFDESSANMKEFQAAIKDLDLFLAKELDEIEIQKRIALSNKEKIFRQSHQEPSDKYGEKILESLQKLKDEINEIKQNQKEFETKIRKQEEYQHLKLLQARMIEEQEKKKLQQQQQRIAKKSSDTASYDQTSESEVSKKNSFVNKKANSQGTEFVSKQASKSSLVKQESNKSENTKKSYSLNLTSSSYSRQERIHKLETEIYKEETLMLKINRVLENMKNIDDKNLLEIVNIERHYLVASTRFQSALAEIRKLNEGIELPHHPPFNRKGNLLIRDIIVEIKPSYFERPIPTKNEFILIMMKYEDKVFATKPMRIIDDVRMIRFTEKFSIPEIYMDFEMRLEIYGTTFWRKNSTDRETMLKKYGFITFTLGDTGNRSKRFQMIEVLQSDNVPIKNKVLMKISQNITTGIQYRGSLFVKLRDIWHEANAHLNGHLLEISFRKIYNSGITQSQETMLLDLYNVDDDAVIPVDVKRISDKPYTFLLKFNHYVDVANF